MEARVRAKSGWVDSRNKLLKKGEERERERERGEVEGDGGGSSSSRLLRSSSASDDKSELRPRTR